MKGRVTERQPRHPCRDTVEHGVAQQGLRCEPRKADGPPPAGCDENPSLFEQLPPPRAAREQGTPASRRHALTPPEAEHSEIAPCTESTTAPPGASPLRRILDDQRAMRIGERACASEVDGD